MFAGQDNASVGGTEKHHDGYVENIGIPGGITHYVYFSEGWTNAFDRTFPIGEVAGLNKETEWASGPMHQKAYLDSPTLDPCVMHLSIAMEGNNEDKVADGSFDHLIAELVTFIKEHPDHPFLIRPGYEFDGSWNKYDPENFKKAFRRIVDALRAEKLPNFAMVFASSSDVKPGQFEEYDPGGEYYEWVGYSWWGGDKDAQPALDYARKVGKPVFIAEATPRGHFFDKEDHEELWNGWFTKFFNHIDENIDVIRAVSYINADWDSQDMWDGWGQSKIETAPYIKKRWLEKMAEPRFINAADDPFEQIGFPAEYSEPKKPVAPYNNATLPVEKRVADLLGRMTIEEKVGQITGWWHYDERKMQEEGKIFTPEFFAEKCPNGIGELGPVTQSLDRRGCETLRGRADVFSQTNAPRDSRNSPRRSCSWIHEIRGELLSCTGGNRLQLESGIDHGSLYESGSGSTFPWRLSCSLTGSRCFPRSPLGPCR